MPCICVLGVSILSLSTILIFDLGMVVTVWYICYRPGICLSILIYYLKVFVYECLSIDICDVTMVINLIFHYCFRL